MSWDSDDGIHEGYVLPEFIDGVRGRGIWTGKVPRDHVVVDVEYVGDPGDISEERYTSRPAAEVIGWRVMCDCRTGSTSRVTATWCSDLITRVPSSALHDPAAGRLYVPDEDVPEVDELFVDDLAGLWRREHVDGEGALSAIAQARSEAAAAERRLDEAVAAARAGGASWEAIGRAAGMTRQSAHGRWSGSV